MWQYFIFLLVRKFKCGTIISELLRNSDEEKYFLIIMEFWSYNKLLCDSNYFLKKFKKLCSKLIQVKIICNNGRVNYPLKTFPKKELYVTPQCVCNYVIYNKKPDNWMCRMMPEQLNETYSTQPSWMTTRQGTGKLVVLAGTSPTPPLLLAVLT